MNLLSAMGCIVLASLACGAGGDLRSELRKRSANGGLALASATAGHIVVIPFDGPERYLESEYRFPITAFGKAGQMLLWWFPTDFLDLNGEFVIASQTGPTVARMRPPVAGFHPVALSEAGGRIAFWGRPRGAALKGLYWASFDFSSSGFVDKVTSYADWSPDGRDLVYDDKKGQIYIFNLSSRASRRLVAGHDPTWSPNGKVIAFLAPTGRASLVSIEGVEVTWPISTHRPLSALRWSPDGQYVSFPEALQAPLEPFGAPLQLLVCRVKDGETTIAQNFTAEAANYASFHWIVEYRKFCSRCTESTSRAK